MQTTALLTDHYELTMLESALRDGSAQRPSVFEVFARRLPSGRRFGVAAGLGRLIDALAAYRFGAAELAFLADETPLSDRTLDQLAGYRFSGDVVAYREGEAFFADSPVLTVSAPFGEAVILETLVLSVLNYDSAVASAAARVVSAADGRPILEFGSRRANEQAAVAAARAAYVAGFSGTSNLEAGRRYGIPTLGTSAHAFMMVHDDELSAFAAQVDALGVGTTLLVDTYDIRQGLEHALAVAGTDLGAVRIDSGDLASEAHRARRYLDEHGATSTRIVLSGDLDEHEVAVLRDAPADGYGVGTSLVTGSGAPTAGFVYKLVARATGSGRPLEPVTKQGGTKATLGGRKRAWRRLRGDGRADAELLRPWDAPAPAGDVRPLQVEVVRGGQVLRHPDLDAIRDHHRAAMAELPDAAFDLADGEPVIPTVHDLPDAEDPRREKEVVP